MRRLFEDTYKNILIPFVFVTSIYLLVLYFLFNMPFAVLSKFVMMNILGIFLPGFAFAALLEIRLSRFTMLMYAYILGYTLTVVEYFVSEIFDRKVSFSIILLLVAILSLAIIIVKKKKGYLFFQKANEEDWIGLLFFVLFLLFSVFSYSALNVGPSIKNNYTTVRDMQFWCSNTVALKVDFPGEKLFMVGNELRYHYFSGIPIAYLSSVFDIDVFALSFPLYSYTKPFLMVGSLFFMLDTLEFDKKTKMFGGILVLFTTGLENKSVVTFIHHTMLSPFGFDVGFALGICFLALLIKQWGMKDFSIPIFVQAILIWGFCVGAKAPLASVLLLFPALVCFYWLIRKDFKKSFIYGGTILTLFILINKCCVMQSTNYDWNSRLGIYTVEQIVNDSGVSFFENLYQRVPIITIFLTVVLKCFFLNPAYFVLTIYSLVFCIKLVKNRCILFEHVYLELTLLLTALWGIGLWIIVNANGRSEMYFSMASFIPLAIFIMLSGKYIMSGLKNSKYIIMHWGAVLVIAFCSYIYLFNGYGGDGVLDVSCSGIANVITINNEEAAINELVSQDEICLEDVKALSWIRDNAERKSVVLSDKAIILDNPSYYLYGIFCERQQYLEGTSTLGAMTGVVHEEIARRQELIKNFYNNSVEAYEQIKEEGVDYVVQTLNITPYFEADIDKYELVSESETIRVYRIK